MRRQRAAPDPSPLQTWQRYWLFQIPGLALAAALLFAGFLWFSLPVWACACGFALWLVKDFVAYPFLKSAYEGAQATGTESMIGAVGTAVERLDPKGFVRIGPELWQAESATPVEAGRTVRVTGFDRMTARVEPDDG